MAVVVKGFRIPADSPVNGASATVAKGSNASMERALGLAPVDRLSFRQVAKDAKLATAVAVPMEALLASQKYRRGELDAPHYLGEVTKNALGFGAWTIAAAMVPAILPLGTPLFLVAAAGFGVGFLANELWDRTAGPVVQDAVASAIPAGLAKPIADTFTKFIANPLADYVWKPATAFIGEHKVLSAVLLGCAALRFPVAAKAVGRTLGSAFLGTAAALGISAITLDRWLPQPAEAATAE